MATATMVAWARSSRHARLARTATTAARGRTACSSPPRHRVLNPRLTHRRLRFPPPPSRRRPDRRPSPTSPARCSRHRRHLSPHMAPRPMWEAAAAAAAAAAARRQQLSSHWRPSVLWASAPIATASGSSAGASAAPLAAVARVAAASAAAASAAAASSAAAAGHPSSVVSSRHGGPAVREVSMSTCQRTPSPSATHPSPCCRRCSPTQNRTRPLFSSRTAPLLSLLALSPPPSSPPL